MWKLMSGAWRAPVMSQVNILYNQLFYGLSAAAGSITSFFLNGALIWALVRLAQGRIAWVTDRRIMMMATVFALYPMAEMWSALINGRGVHGFINVLGQIVFLAVLPVASRLVLSKPEDILKSAGQGAAFAGVFAFLYSLFEVAILHAARAEAGYGNPAVMGVIALTLSCICLAAMPAAKGRERWWLMAGALSAIGALLLSGTRGVWLAAPVSLALAATPFWPRLRLRLKKSAMSAGVLAALLLAGGLALIASMGYRETVTSLGTLVGGGSDLSVGRRIVLWDAGLSQAWESPWTGFGPDSVREKILSIKPLGSLGYSHYQNFVINSLIRGGIFELLALLAIPASIIWFARKPSLTEAERAGKAILLSVCSTFYLTGLVGILFTHDIMNAVFVYTVIVGLCIAEPSAVTASGPAIAQNASDV